MKEELLRVRTSRDAHHQAAFKRLLEVEDVDIWNQVGKLLVRKSYHVPSEYPVDLRIEMAKLSAVYTTKSVALAHGIPPGSATQMMQEIGAAVTFILGEDNEYIPYSKLSHRYKLRYHVFSDVEKLRDELRISLDNEEIVKLILGSVPLRLMCDILDRDLGISRFLEELEIDVPPNVNIHTYRFFVYGDRNGGTRNLSRKVLYKHWARQDNIENNCKGVGMDNLLQNVYAKIKDIKPENQNLKNKKRHYLQFIEYLCLKDIEKLRLNKEIPDNFWKLYDGVEVNPLEEKHYQLRMFPRLIPQLFQFAHDTTKSSERSVLVHDIARLHGKLPATAKKIYDAGIILLDNILQIESATDFTLDSKITQDFLTYVKLMQKFKNNAKLK